MPETRGVALLIGVEEVDAYQYDNVWKGELPGATRDVDAIAELLARSGWNNEYSEIRPPLLSRSACRDTVLAEIDEAAGRLRRGGLFILSFSGHGGLVPSPDGEEKNDSTFCLYDGMLLDDELADAWCAFPAGARILLIADSCHSGSVAYFRPTHSSDTRPSVNPAAPLRRSFARAVPHDVAMATYQLHSAFYEGKQLEIARRRSNGGYTHARTCQGERIADRAAPVVQCTVLQLSACRDAQSARGTATGGKFTLNIRRRWEEQRSTELHGGYVRFFKGLTDNAPRSQTPQCLLVGAADDEFVRQLRPFAVPPSG